VRRVRLLPKRAGALAAAIVIGLLVGPYLLPLPAVVGADPAAFGRPDGRFLDVDGTRTYLEASGPSQGPAVVLVHGFGGSTYSWRFTRPVLAAAGYRVLALDLRGFGLATKGWEADHGHAAQARLVLAAMDAEGMREAVLVGHSMGANVVAHAALAAPDRVRALVLVDAAIVGAGARPGGGTIGAAGSSPLATLLGVPSLRRAAQIAVRLALGRAAEPILRSAYADPAFPTAADVAAYGAAQQLADWDLALLAIVRDAGRNALPAPVAALATGRPVLVAWGEHDPWIPLATGEALRDAIPGAAWLAVPGAGHLPMEEGRAEFEAGLLAFLEDLR
jgi:pimeloyl-ACP methyl ester carboxylesterase